MLVLLLLVVAVAIGCVLWFMREAMRNERLAVRQKLSDAYQGQLDLLRKGVDEQWRRELDRLERGTPGPSLFLSAVREGWADAIICIDATGRTIYPQLTSIERDGEANAELLAIEKMTDRSDPHFDAAVNRLIDRANDYESTRMPAPQRRFLMRELLKLRPSAAFPTLPAEDLAAKYLDANPVNGVAGTLHESRVKELWACSSPGGRVIVLFTTATLRARLESPVGDNASLGTVRITAIPPSAEPPIDALAATSLAPFMPGWRLALSLADQAVLDGASERRVAAYLWIGGVVVAAITLLIVVIARGFTRQVNLARMKNDLVANRFARIENAAYRRCERWSTR
jgi:hypothetical protein